MSMFCEILLKAGYEFNVPDGTFYLYPKSPIPDDGKFLAVLMENNILAAPGSAFGGPGYFRLSFAVPDKTILGSADGFKKALESL